MPIEVATINLQVDVSGAPDPTAIADAVREEFARLTSSAISSSGAITSAGECVVTPRAELERAATSQES